MPVILNGEGETSLFRRGKASLMQRMRGVVDRTKKDEPEYNIFLCKNTDCKKDRRYGSAYCQRCSDRHAKVSAV